MVAGATPASSAMNYESTEGSRKGKMMPGCSIPCGGARQRVDSVSEVMEKLDPSSATRARNTGENGELDSASWNGKIACKGGG
jgi:hypothetical protein